MNTNYFDGLDTDPMIELIASPSRGNPPAPRGEFVERCKKCNGSGNFTSYSGRVVGPCFVCKGQGSKTFKNSAEDRARAAVKTATRKANAADQNLEDFKVAHPDLWSWMDGNSFAFAVSMIEAIRKYGSLTERQEAAVRKCVDQEAARAIAKAQAMIAKVEQNAAAPSIDMSAIETALNRALVKMQRPKLRVGGLAFKFAPASGKNAGAIYATTSAGLYLGKIKDSKFFASRECTEELTTQLKEVAADPKAAAIAHGFNTGSCSCCGRMLTDPKSVAMGIGPICAANFGW